MPELPDLQVFSRNLTKMLAGKTVDKVEIHNKKKIKIPLKKFNDALAGQKLKRVYRDGKELHFEFSAGDILALHLMLRGQLHIFEGKNEKKFPVIELYFSDNTGLAMSDFQGQATPTLNPPTNNVIDALDVDYNFLHGLLSKKKAAVKNILLDQKLVRGIGNAYADEILWKARISPFAAANKIPESYVKALEKAIKSVLENAEKMIQKEEPGIISGELRDFLEIHNHHKKKSPTGAEILVKAVGARKTYYTNEQEKFE